MSRRADQPFPRFSIARLHIWRESGLLLRPATYSLVCLPLALPSLLSRATRSFSRVRFNTPTPLLLSLTRHATLMSAESTYLSLGCDCSCVVRGMLAHRAHEPSPPSFTRRSSPPSGCTTCRAIGATARASRRPTWACVRATACASPTSCYFVGLAHTTATERYVSRLPHDPTQAVLIHADP